jgi:hypothetical protein
MRTASMLTLVSASRSTRYRLLLLSMVSGSVRSLGKKPHPGVASLPVVARLPVKLVYAPYELFAGGPYRRRANRASCVELDAIH